MEQSTHGQNGDPMNTGSANTVARPLAILVVAWVLLCLWLFAPVLFSGHTLVSSDGCPYYGARNGMLRTVQSYVGAWAPNVIGFNGGLTLFQPQHLLSFVTSTLGYHNGLYMLNLLLSALGGYAILRALGCSRRSAVLSGLGFAFSGYYLTLISAGHRGILSSIPWALFMLAALVRAMDRVSPLHFCLAAICATFGLNAQADVTALFVLVGGAYGLFRVIHDPLSGAPAFRASPARWGLKLAAGLLLALAVFAATAVPFASQFRRTILPGREEQIQRVGEDPEVFCTNWSMPPAEVAEFWAPNVFGRDTGNPELPYWGSLGRSLGWAPNGKQGGPGTRNLRQHTLYPGAVGLCLAFVALVCGATARGRGRAGAPPADEPRPAETAFWGGVLGISLLLAFGRYTPVYHYFYTFFPLADKFRCPVKLIHVTVMALYVLAGIGLDRWLRAPGGPSGPSAGWRRADVAGLAYCGIVLAALACAWMYVQGHQAALFDLWARLGFSEPGVGPRLLAGLSGALRHGLFVHAALAALLAASVMRRRTSGGKAGSLSGLFLGGLLVLQGLDQGSAGRSYLRTADVSGWYYNPVVGRMKALEPHGRAWWTYAPLSSSFFFGWNSFFSQGIAFASPRDQDKLDNELQNFYGSLSKASQERLWQMTSCAFVVAPTEQGLPLLKGPATRFEPVGYLAVDRRRQRWMEVPGPADSDFMVLRYLDALPRAQVYFGWQTATNRDQALRRLSAADFRPDRDLLVTSGGAAPADRTSSRPPAPARIVRMSGSSVKIDVDAAEDGVLLLTDRHDEGWSVTVDGRRAQPLQCNYLLRGVAVPAGRHAVVWTFRPFLPSGLLSAGVFGAVLLWWLAAGRLNAKAGDQGAG